MAKTYTTVSQLTQPVNVIFQRTLLDNAKPMAPYFAGTESATIMSHNGSFTASWRRIENLTPTTSALSALSSTIAFPTRDTTAPSTTNVSATLAKYGQVIVMNEEADLINFTEQMDKLVEVIGISAGRSLNMLQRNEEEDNSTAVLGSGASSATAITSKVTLKDIRNVVNTLNRNSARKFTPQSAGSANFNTTPIRSAYWGLTHPDVEEDIRLLAGFVPVEQYGGSVGTADGEFGAVAGVRFIASEDASIDAEGGGTSTGTGLRTSGNSKVDLYNTVIYGRQAFGSVGLDIPHLSEVYQAGDQLPPVQLITKARGSSGVADPLDEVSSIGWKSWHAARVLNTAWSRNLRTGASDLS